MTPFFHFFHKWFVKEVSEYGLNTKIRAKTLFSRCNNKVERINRYSQEGRPFKREMA